jgi:sugar phosphate isomerase/epimerase
MSRFSRRTFIRTSASAALIQSIRIPALHAAAAHSPFKVAVINDEISPDLDHACSVVANDFGLKWIELRSAWGKSLMDLPDDELKRAETILAKYHLQVTDIASPLFKTDWPGAPKSKYGSKNDLHGAAEATFKQQDEILEKSVALAKRFKTDKVRCFDFWRLDDQEPYRKDIDDKLHEAADKCSRDSVLLVLENEFACNTATGREAGRAMNAVQTSHLALNWDPGNAVMRGELDAYPGGWDAIPKDRIHHCHCKSAEKDSTGKIEWAPIGKGYVDWVAQFSALKAAGFRDAVSLETHWHGGGTPEESTRISWAGMKDALTRAAAF